MKSAIGFMQGRLSPLYRGRIQAFPWDTWRQEFSIARTLGFTKMEWTLDQDRLAENPIMTSAGRLEIKALQRDFGIEIPSLTGDCFMQAPFWKAGAEKRTVLQADFCAIVEACSALGTEFVVVPLVDGGRLETAEQTDILLTFLTKKTASFKEMGVKIIFESDWNPVELARFIEQLPPSEFGINYDMGNSAALNFDVVEEMSAYGDRVRNVHVKDRLLGGGTVALGTGSVAFERVFAALASAGYAGNFILQTARSENDQHAEVLSHYAQLILGHLERTPSAATD